ncbi:hypothetical protein LAUMK41_02386 [Mycobacterium attenuatum]|nr:hypothetical protein LAUMK41_02386 [Mycobacterium attenuatum]
MIFQSGAGRRSRLLRQRRHIRRHLLNRRRARQISRRFACVGVDIPVARLQAIAAGAPVASDELADIDFALIATKFTRENRRAALERGRRRCARWLLIAGVAMGELCLMALLGLVVLSLALHQAHM